MSQGKGFIGCTRCYKKKVDCKCIISDFHIIQSRAFYYWKFIENYPELKEKELGLKEKELSGVNHSQLRNTDKSVRRNLKPSGGLVSCNPSGTRKGLCNNPICGHTRNKHRGGEECIICGSDKCKKFEELVGGEE